MGTIPASNSVKNSEWCVAIFKDFAIRSKDLQGRFKFGDNDEMNPDMESYPYMYVAPTDISIQPNLGGKSGYSAIEATFDVPIADKLESSKENELQTVSDIQEILFALVAELGSHPYYVQNNMKLVGDVPLTTSLEADDAILSKVTARITLRYPFQYTYCNVPVDDIPFYPEITTDIFGNVTDSLCTLIEGCPVIITIENTLIDLQNQINNIVGGGGVETVTGVNVDDSDPVNPIVEPYTSYQSYFQDGNINVPLSATCSPNHYFGIGVSTPQTNLGSVVVPFFAGAKDGAYVQIELLQPVLGGYSLLGAVAGGSNTIHLPAVYFFRYSADFGTWNYLTKIETTSLPRPIYTFPYEIKTTIQNGDPLARHLIYNSVTQISSTRINISATDDTNLFVDPFLEQISLADILLIREDNNVLNFQRWQVTGNKQIFGTYVSVPVALVSSSGTGTSNFGNNQKVNLYILT